MAERKGVGSSQTVYVYGNTVRKEREAARPVREQNASISRQALMNRERSLQMNLRYVVFLTVAAVLTVAICVNYLKLQAQYTSLQKDATRLETSLSELKLENDARYNRIISTVNLEEAKEAAMERLGMVYASEDQIVEYLETERDYVKQYQDLPGNG